MWTGDTPNAPWANQPTQTQQPFTNQQPYFTAGNNQGISNLGYGASQLAGTSAPGLEKQNLDYALSQLGMMTGNYGGGGYTQPGDFGSATNPQSGVTYDSSDYTTPGNGIKYGLNTETGGYISPGDEYRSPQDYQDYLTGGRSFLQGALGLFGPLGTGLGIATDYNMGFSTLSPNTGENLGYTNPFTDEYSAFYNENYAGPGSDMAFTQDLMYPTEQRDMLINQQSFDILPEQTEETFMDWIGGMFGGNTLNYDPDMDLERSGWSDTTPAAPGSFDNRLQGPWSGTDTYNNSLEGYANAEQINKDFNEMNVNWQDELNAAISSNPTEVSDFGKIYGMLGEGIMKDLTSQQANLTGEDLEQVKSLQNYLFDYTSPQDAVEKMGKDTQVKMDVIRNELNVNKELDAKDRKELTDQLNTYNTRFNARLDNDIESSKVEINILRDQLANNNKLTTEARKVFEQQLTARTNKLYNDSLDKVNNLTTQLQDVGVNNTTKYNDLLSKLETIEGDLTQQINDFYTGPNVGNSGFIIETPTVADAVASGKPFGKEGDDSWSPNGSDVFHGPGHNWNTPDSENKSSIGTVTAPSDEGVSFDLGGTSTPDEDAQAEIDSSYDDSSESSGPSAPGSGYTGSDGGGGSFDSGSSGTDDSDASDETGDYSSYDSPDDSSGGWGW
jgi:hypothetical protein